MFSSFIEPKVRLGELLVERHHITQAQLDDAVRQQSINPLPLGELLILNGAISRRQMQRTLKWQSLVRVAAVVTSFSLAPVAFAQGEGMAIPQANVAGEEQVLEYGSRPATTQILSLLLSLNAMDPISYAIDRTYQLETPRTNDNLLAKFTSGVKFHVGTPLVSLLKGRYDGGVDTYTQGIAYKARWTEQSVKLGMHYQF